MLHPSSNNVVECVEIQGFKTIYVDWNYLDPLTAEVIPLSDSKPSEIKYFECSRTCFTRCI